MGSFPLIRTNCSDLLALSKTFCLKVLLSEMSPRVILAVWRSSFTVEINFTNSVFCGQIFTDFELFTTNVPLYIGLVKFVSLRNSLILKNSLLGVRSLKSLVYGVPRNSFRETSPLVMTGTTLKSHEYTSQFKKRVAGKCDFRSLKVEEQIWQIFRGKG